MQRPTENSPGANPEKGALRTTRVLSESRGANSGLVLHPRGHRLVSAWCGHSGGLDLWNTATGERLQSFNVDVELTDIGSQVQPELLPPGSETDMDSWPANVLPVTDLAISGLGSTFAIAAGRALRVYNLTDNDSKLLRSHALRRHEGAILRVALDRSGEKALSAEASGRLFVWDLKAETLSWALSISSIPQRVQFIWNDMMALCGDHRGRIICWELTKGSRHLQFQAHHGNITATAFSEETGVLLTGGSDSAVRLWNLEAGRQMGVDMVHRTPISAVIFARNGQVAITASTDGLIGVWDAATGQLFDWTMVGEPIYKMTWDPVSGALIVSGETRIRVMEINWGLLESQPATAVEQAPAQAAAQPATSLPALEPNYQEEVGRQAPVGSFMAARQTSELPIPDRSDLSIERARPGRIGQAPAVEVAVPQEAAPQGAPPAVAPPSKTAGLAFRPGFGAPTTARNNESVHSSLAETIAMTQRLQAIPAIQVPTPGADPTAAEPQAIAAPQPLRSASASGAGPLPGSGESALTPSRSNSASTEGSIPAKLSPAPKLSSEPEAPVEPTTRDNRSSYRFLAMVAVVLVLGLATRAGVYWYYTTQAWPGSLASEAQAVENDFQTQRNALQGPAQERMAREQANIRQIRNSDTMTPEAADRAIERAEGRIADEERRLQAGLQEVQESRNEQLSRLGENRAQVAGSSGNFAALVVLLIGTLLTLLFLSRGQKKETVRTSPRTAPGRTAPRGRR